MYQNEGLAKMIIDNIEGIARWLRGHLSVMLNVARSRPVRYIRITPGLSFSNKAIVFDIKKLKFLKLKIRSKTESIVVDQIMVGRCYDTSNLRRHQDIMKRYDEIIRSEMIPLIVDCGGNIGISALWFSEEFKDAQVICIEPSLENVSSAKINAPASETINAAVGAEIGTCEIANPGANSWAYRVAVGTGEIPVFPIEEILIKYPKEKFTPFMIKIDIEGFEGELL